ncbi:hypothetical protein B0H67DRAFT_550100 [Lasiosphaeris hirsuta]|uniref:Uncharacterized protein n=1 Tax=Lasiosphaeris hirsuta TaxID=260670 RepID=A0AA40AYH6_9PEZI|nr:hypothetical protein B0H67DRAFT_550100 [Lasiosphaeris hirsuta]
MPTRVQQSQPGTQPHGVCDKDPFTFENLRRLNNTAAELHKASLVMELNAGVMTDLSVYYKALFDSADFPGEIKLGCSCHLSDFDQRFRATIRSLQAERARISTLMSLLDDARALVDKFLQFRNIEQNKLFALIAHQNAQQMADFTKDVHCHTCSTGKMDEVTTSMHAVAEKTTKETPSMRIVTVVALIFLPGTFVAARLGLLPPASNPAALLTCSQTFFGTGLFSMGP